MVKIEVLQGDITTVPVDAIVNAANSELRGGGGVDGAIQHAGGPSILEECRRIRQSQGICVPGDAVVTGAGRLPAKFVIHAVGPIWSGGESDEDALLAQCYRRSLSLAEKLGAQSISFPNISTGVYRFPKARAAGIAIRTVQEVVQSGSLTIEKVWFVCFDQENYELYQRLLKASTFDCHE
ncbi:MAG: O-acetyl-ADP-ribose deacetylase [Spirochaetales bacterium]|nr:O-acetyl-ADP-ribose deacetylase [Spirochaetales bacterium]